MPNRIIREGILTSDRVEQLDPPAEVFYRRLMSKVDDHGLYDARPSILRASLYPLRIDRVREADCSRWIAACEKAGLIALYQHDGRPYVQMLDTRWQARSEAKYPLPGAAESKPRRAPDNSCAQPLSTAPVFVDVVGDGDGKTPLATQGPPFALPDWIPAEQWAAFIAMRNAKGKRAPFTDAARDGVVAELAKLKRDGHNPGDVLTASVVNGWSGVFPPKTVRGAAEPAWRTEQRERNEAFLGPAAARKTATVIDLEAHDAATLRLG
jgi:hypothetical protein